MSNALLNAGSSLVGAQRIDSQLDTMSEVARRVLMLCILPNHTAIIAIILIVIIAIRLIVVIIAIILIVTIAIIAV